MDISEFTARRQTLTAATGDIAYTESGAGPAAVFVHGLATSGALWRHVIEQVDGTTRCIAVDLPLHGGTPPREDPSVTAMAQLIVDLCQDLRLDRIDLVGNDTGGVVAQIVAARHPELVRSLVLTNCDTEGNFPPQAFMPVIEAAGRGEIAPLLTVAAANPAAARMSPLATGYEHPDKVPDEVWREYLTPIGETIERARLFERMLTALDPAELDVVAGAAPSRCTGAAGLGHRRGGPRGGVGVPLARPDPRCPRGRRDRRRQTLLPRGAARETGRPAAPPLGTLTTILS